MKQFEYVEAMRPQRSAFDLSHERKTTLNMGELVPVLCTEVLPGDRFKIDFEAFLRTMPLVSPVMHRVNMYAHAFFVPMRILLSVERWEKFITQQTGYNPVLPTFNVDIQTGAWKAVSGDVFDHLGYGLKFGSAAGNGLMSQLPVRGYHKIWSDYYRDQNFETEFDPTNFADNLTAAANQADLALLAAKRFRAWEKDYFTSALPTQQRGAAVALPLGTTAPVQGVAVRTHGAGDNMKMQVPTTGAPTPAGGLSGDAAGNILVGGGTVTIAPGGLEANLSAATGATISSLRQAFALQRWYEASMRFGQRYAEQILGIFGIKYSDARLQRSEFLVGGRLPVQIGEVLQTSATVAGQTVQGNMAGKGHLAGNSFHLDRTFDEHGYIYVIVSVVPRTSYATMALRQNFKISTFDFAFPQLAHLSEQPVYAGELYNDAVNDAQARTPFGYQPMYTEYRYIPDSVHGDFRGSLGFWSLARDYAAAPALNSTFTQCKPRNDIFPVAFANQQLLLQSYAKITAIRPLPKFGTPI